jgi:hypothetical protein
VICYCSNKAYYQTVESSHPEGQFNHDFIFKISVYVMHDFSDLPQNFVTDIFLSVKCMYGIEF